MVDLGGLLDTNFSQDCVRVRPMPRVPTIMSEPKNFPIFASGCGGVALHDFFMRPCQGVQASLA